MTGLITQTDHSVSLILWRGVLSKYIENQNIKKDLNQNIL